MKLYRKFYQVTITKLGCLVTLQSCVLAVKDGLHMADFCIWPTGTKRAGELGVCGTINQLKFACVTMEKALPELLDCLLVTLLWQCLFLNATFCMFFWNSGTPVCSSGQNVATD